MRDILLFLDRQVTRWYRAPELILLQREYGPSIDVWSIGCVLGELLSMQRSVCASRHDREPLFPGDSCFPLSAKHSDSYKSEFDQLNMIFDLLGTPTKEDIANVKHDKARGYLGGLRVKAPQDLAAKFPGTDPLALDLLAKLLTFDPDNRITVRDAVRHPYFDAVRQPAWEAASKRPEVLELSAVEDIAIAKPAIQAAFQAELVYFQARREAGASAAAAGAQP